MTNLRNKRAVIARYHLVVLDLPELRSRDSNLMIGWISSLGVSTKGMRESTLMIGGNASLGEFRKGMCRDRMPQGLAKGSVTGIIQAAR